MSRLLKTAELLAALWGLAAFLYYWDPSRVLVKRLVADSPYLYEDVHPRFQQVPVDDLITVRDKADIADRRRGLARAVWGGRNPSPPVDAVRDLLSEEGPADCPLEGKEAIFFATLECGLDDYRRFDNLSRLLRLEIPVEADYRAVAALFVPAESNGEAVLYHHGYAGTHHQQYRYLEQLIGRGYTVAAFNLPGYGDNIRRDLSGPLPEPGPETARWVLTPVMAVLDHLSARIKPERVSMIGFSAGGWAAAMAAALDPRIRSSFIVASPYPLAFRDTPASGPEISRIGEVMDVANYYDLFVLASAGDERGPRRQMHIYNRYDRCCWNNRTAELFEPPVAAVAESLGGRFSVGIDGSHARHKISKQAFAWILDDLEGGGR